MRRKCFFSVIIIIAVLVILDSFKIPLTSEKTGFLYDTNHEFIGKIAGIQRTSAGGLKLAVDILLCDCKELPSKERVLLNYYGDNVDCEELFNRTVSFRTTLTKPSGRRNPNCFDYSKYLKSRGIYKVGNIKSFKLEESRLSLKEEFEAFLIAKRFQFENSLDENARGLIMGVLFGDVSSLDEEAYEDFRNNGTAHILSVSGLHVGILYGIYKKIVGKRKSYPALAVLAVFLYAYGTMSMWSPSVIRATLMIAMSITARLLDLRYDMVTGLSTVALILIINDPYVVFGAGFQMSFLAIASIGFLRPLIPMRVPDLMASAIAVNLGLVVYQMYQFNYVSLISILANLPMVYLTGILVPAALIGFICFTVAGGSPFIDYVINSLSFLTLKLNEFSTLGGYGAAEVVSPPLAFVLLWYFGLFFLSSETFKIMLLRRKKKKIAAILAAISVLALSLSGLNYSAVSDDDVVFVDVGQGDCIHIKEGNTDILIDGGGNINFNLGKKTLKPYLLKNGVWDIDVALATHEHTDHYKGLKELSEEFNVKELRSSMTMGDMVYISDNVRIETLWPAEYQGAEAQDENRFCSVFMIYYKTYKILITGDLDGEGEQLMLKAYEGTGKLKADILKIGHHGSITSTSDEFLSEVAPIISVIQVGKNNYGHPAEKIIEKNQKKGIMVYRCDYSGAIGLRLKNEGISVHEEMNPEGK